MGNHVISLLFYGFTILYVVIFSHLAALAPIVMGVTFLTTPLIALFSGFSAYKLSLALRPFKKAWFGVFLVTVFLFYSIMRQAERVVTFGVPSNAMSPTLIAGDIFALDQRPSRYGIKDVVAVEMGEPKRLVMRRVIGFSNDRVTLNSDSDPKKDESASIADLKGKALYIVYSRPPGSFQLLGDRFLLPVK